MKLFIISSTHALLYEVLLEKLFLDENVLKLWKTDIIPSINKRHLKVENITKGLDKVWKNSPLFGLHIVGDIDYDAYV